MPRAFNYLMLRKSIDDGVPSDDSDEDSLEDCMNITEFELRPIKKKLVLNKVKELTVDKPVDIMVDIKPERLVLEPGQVIRPTIDHEGVKLLVERLYGISVLELTELNGYDDKNYKIIEDPNVKNPLITEHCADGYVLKIMNSMDSQNLEVVEAQNEIMNFLNARSVVCPKPIRNVFGHLHSLETLGGKQHAVRLLQYVPGELLKDHKPSDALLYQLGQATANLDNKLQVSQKLQNFNHSGVVNRQHIWMLSKVPELEKFKYVLKETEKLDLAEEVIEEFKYAVVPKLEELEKGVIHGDINEANILVAKSKDKNDYQIAGILDFGDIQYSPYIFELAIAMSYAMLITSDPRAGGLVLAGYQVTRRVPKEEIRLLKTLVSARLVQSLVLGAYTLAQDPGNTYVSSTERSRGWELLAKIRKTKYSPEEQDPTDWQGIADQYLTRS